MPEQLLYCRRDTNMIVSVLVLSFMPDDIRYQGQDANLVKKSSNLETMRLKCPMGAPIAIYAASDICALDSVRVSEYATRRLLLLNTHHIPYLFSCYNIHT